MLSFVLFMVLAYSIKGLRFKEIPFLDSITSSCHFVGPLVFALVLTASASQNWPYILAFFLWGMASHAFGAVQDIIPDRDGGLQSIATRLGARRTVWFSLMLYAVAVLAVWAQGGTGNIAVGSCGLLYIMNIAGYSSVSDEDSARTNKAWKRFIWLNYFTGFVVTLVLLGYGLGYLT